MLTRRPLGLAMALVLSLVVAACSTSEGTPAASAPAPGGSVPAASPGGSAPAGSPGAGGADISGDLQVLARYGCEPAPCEPSGEGAADARPGARRELREAAHHALLRLLVVAVGQEAVHHGPDAGRLRAR